ncbi:MAG: acyl-CoA dehydratase activase [Paludibacteraceae bacterium]
MTELYAGIDIGSTTVKLVIITPDGTPLFSVYERHNARQADTLLRVLQQADKSLTERGIHLPLRVAVCGSGGRTIAEHLHLPFIQEVVANAAAVSKVYSHVRTAVELGGQDAKIIFFTSESPQGGASSDTTDTAANDGHAVANDMRMNGSCAGGTGAFIDEIAALLKCPIEEFNDLASRGTRVYEISGRCGVFAKTDIQPLLLQGARREDIALSAFHAIAKQVIGGLSQGLKWTPPVIFEGGPLTFNPCLVKVFAQRLHLSEQEVVLPDHPETFVAYGAAVAVRQIFADAPAIETAQLTVAVDGYRMVPLSDEEEPAPLFSSEEERMRFTARHDQAIVAHRSVEPPPDRETEVYIGIDSGSTTSKFVALNEHGEVVYRFYRNNHGKPLDVLRDGLIAMRDTFAQQGIRLRVGALGTTGYGERITAAAFGADYHTVETIARAQGCLHYIPDASFILDIGGQDMKAIWMRNGVITRIMLNEACSSGCGSFLENFADTLGIPVEEIADHAFRSTAPARLGCRCTVFMNSTIINEQRRAKTEDDIMAGLCRSIVENVFTKVIRLNNLQSLGDRIVVQGGTFRNRAVLRAFEEYVGKEVTLAPFAGEMGAIGIARLAREQRANKNSSSSFIGFEALKQFQYRIETDKRCGKCENNCALTVTRFLSLDRSFTFGNRCERGNRQDPPRIQPPTPQSPAAPSADYTPADLFALRQRLLFADYPLPEEHRRVRKKVVGIPRVLEFWESMPFWTTFFRALGYEVRLSRPSSRARYEEGLPFVASDTICFPAKLVHGHLIDLVRQQADILFMPYVMHMPPEGTDHLSPYVCSVVQGYPMVTRHAWQPEERYGVHFLTPVFHFFTPQDRHTQIERFAVGELHCTRREARRAYRCAEQAMLTFRQRLREAGGQALRQLREQGRYGIVLAGRPYHSDSMVNHRLPAYFTARGLAVFTVDSLPTLCEQDLEDTRVEITNNFHTRMLAAAKIAADTPELEYAQIVSFGCGHDAILSDEIVRIMETEGHKSPLILKVDESDAAGALSIRVQSFIESVAIRRRNARKQGATIIAGVSPAYMVTAEQAEPDRSPAATVRFLPADKQLRTLLVPNISREVSTLLCAVFAKQGFRVQGVPIGGIRQIQTGKRYSHNDICFPCQMVIGELIHALREGGYRQDEVAVGMVKFQCDCRLSHYAALLRKALDAAGYSQVPVLTTDPNDTKHTQPGVQLLSARAVIEAVHVFVMLDIVQDLVRRIRPYESNTGETDRLFQRIVNDLAEAIRQGIARATDTFRRAIQDLKQVPYDRTHLKPRAFVTGELLVTYHPGSNFHIEQYLEQNGMETIFPRVPTNCAKTSSRRWRKSVTTKPTSRNIPSSLRNSSTMCRTSWSALPLPIRSITPPPSLPNCTRACDISFPRRSVAARDGSWRRRLHTMPKRA